MPAECPGTERSMILQIRDSTSQPRPRAIRFVCRLQSEPADASRHKAAAAASPVGSPTVHLLRYRESWTGPGRADAQRHARSGSASLGQCPIAENSDASPLPVSTLYQPRLGLS
jgi:hypothetical protein